MIAATGSLELAHARISARYGRRADATTWPRLEPIRAWPAFVDAARKSSLGHWLSALDARSDSHDVERALRGHWRDEVGEVAAWMTGEWHEAVLWWSTWVDLPVLEYLARGEPVLAWMAHDPIYRRLTASDTDVEHADPASADAQRSSRLLAGLRDSGGQADAALAHWCDLWRALMPAAQSHEPLQLELRRILHDHLTGFAASELRDGWPLRHALAERLAMLFRRALLEPASAFIYLALTALDFERLRGELVRRAIFASHPRLRVRS